MTDWHVWRDEEGDETRFMEELAKPPPWRDRDEPERLVDRQAPALSADKLRRAENWVAVNEADTRNAVNMALLLRRPLLVRGKPGLGKSTLALHLALRLGLGRPLRWEIGSRTTLADGLYRYDAVGHLAAMRRWEIGGVRGDAPRLDRFVTLGPLGTAMLPTSRPRLLLVDELDKASYDLPNDLLHVLEEGGFVIGELIREPESTAVAPFDAQSVDDRVPVGADGRIATWRWPVVVITSNDEREFPEAFLRRCVQHDLVLPDDDEARIQVTAAAVRAWFGASAEDVEDFVARFEEAPIDRILAAYQLHQRHAPSGAYTDGLRLKPTEDE